MQRESTTDQLKRIDSQRPDFPGEHIVVLGIGAFLMWKAATGRSFLFRTLAGAVGSALIGRAASGTGGIARVAGVLGKSRGF